MGGGGFLGPVGRFVGAQQAVKLVLALSVLASTAGNEITLRVCFGGG